ncbi:serine/threonine protein kinase [Shewanella sp. HL-SH2]|uniref:serine/threonine protein kinase n=1 Tax=Shewanella sp. HL-SH2 TaxID=3436238 RepID=UPI003EBBF130
MDAQKALSMLGLTETATTAEIAVAAKAKMAQLQEKQEAAPTEALKAKFDQLLMQVNEAQALLQSAASATASVKKPSSPLSQTKLADLPNMAGATAPVELQVGQILAGRYQIKAQIGAGGMGVVYSAFDQSMGRDIALKVLLPELLKNDTARERFLNEARISQQLSHPNIVNVFDVQNDGELYFLTMELLEGQDLRQVMENRTLARQPFTVEEAQDIANAIGTALTYAHKYTIHRDLKPENVWLTDDGVYKLMDFGIAQVQSTSQRTKTGAAMGTAYYMAPEQLKGQKDIDGRADQYALAVMLYELLSGEVPAGMIEPLNQHRKDAPKSMVAAIHQGLASKAENRFIDVEHFVAALTKKGGTSLPAMPWKPIGLAAGVLIALLGIGGVLSFGSVDWASMLPKSKEELASQKANVAKAQGEIKVYKQRLESGRRQLDSDVRDAQRNSDTNLAALQQRQQITESSIFSSNLITELEGDLSMAETLLRENSFESAQVVMDKVSDGYKNLLKEFGAAEFLLIEKFRATEAKNQWLEFKGNEKSEEPKESKVAIEFEINAIKKMDVGDFLSSLNLWKQAADAWLSARLAADSLLAQRSSALIAETEWLKRKDNYGLKDSEYAEQAKINKSNAHEQEMAGEFELAANLWLKARELWTQASESVKDELVKIDRQRKVNVGKKRDDDEWSRVVKTNTSKATRSYLGSSFTGHLDEARKLLGIQLGVEQELALRLISLIIPKETVLLKSSISKTDYTTYGFYDIDIRVVLNGTGGLDCSFTTYRLETRETAVIFSYRKGYDQDNYWKYYLDVYREEWSIPWGGVFKVNQSNDFLKNDNEKKWLVLTGLRNKFIAEYNSSRDPDDFYSGGMQKYWKFLEVLKTIEATKKLRMSRDQPAQIALRKGAEGNVKKLISICSGEDL